MFDAATPFDYGPPFYAKSFAELCSFTYKPTKLYKGCDRWRGLDPEGFLTAVYICSNRQATLRVPQQNSCVK